ncbi:MAG: hypothetical protein OXQ84_03740 [bacterium]|nr:hypothetical protein [bacterium]
MWFGNRQARRVLLTEGVEDALAAITALPSDTLETHAVVASAGAPRMVLDCENLTCINSTGRHTILIGTRACRQADGKLTGYIDDIRQQCRPVMKMSGFLSVIDCQETCEAVLDALARGRKPVSIACLPGSGRLKERAAPGVDGIGGQ